MKALFTSFAVFAATPVLAQEANSQPITTGEEAAKAFIIVDGHIDLPYSMFGDGTDPVENRAVVDFSYERAVAGGLNAPFMSIYTPAELEDTGGSKARADVLIGLMEGLTTQYPGKFEIARSPKDVRRIADEEKIALPLGMENGSPIEGDLKNLKHFYDRGIRYITLAHSKSNHISDSSYDENEKWDGLSPFGFELVRAMNDLGIIIDVSHITDAAMEDVLSLSRAPVMASHSSLRHFTPGWERNISDDLVRKVAANGGVVMINYGSAFLTEAANTYSNRRTAAREAHISTLCRAMTPEETEAWDAQWAADKPYPFATLDDVLNHIDRAVEVGGIDHVGIGSDYDGVGDSLPEGLKDVSSYPALAQGLIDRGYDIEAIEKILGGNALRVWEEVEKAQRRRKFN